VATTNVALRGRGRPPPRRRSWRTPLLAWPAGRRRCFHSGKRTSPRWSAGRWKASKSTRLPNRSTCTSTEHDGRNREGCPIKFVARSEAGLCSIRPACMRKRRTGKVSFTFPNGWGGCRPGAGQKPRGDRAGVSHRTRARLASRYPVHVTVRVRKGLRSLRGRREQRVLLEAFRRGSERLGFRLVQYSVQSNHVHMLVEARGRDALSRGMGGLATRMARGLNRLWSRSGKVFADRYHDQILRTPRQVRNALRYVLNNARKHGVALASDRPDPCSSGRWFDGWREGVGSAGGAPVARARTWLLNVGWRRYGRIGVAERPSG
jgi:putative transposase